MFDPDSDPRVFGVPPGVDFPDALVQGLITRLKSSPPEAMARVELFVNTRRMQRRLRTLFEAESACFLPRIRLITDLAHSSKFMQVPPAVSPLKRRLELAQLVAKLLEKRAELGGSQRDFRPGGQPRQSAGRDAGRGCATQRSARAGC